MSKWTLYQLVILLGFTILIVLNQLYVASVRTFFSFIEQWVPTQIFIVFFTIIIVVWCAALLLIIQTKKKKDLFVHKIWRIMPAIMGVLFILSFCLAMFLFMTSLANISPTYFWLLDVSIIYFNVILYLFILSLFIRYGKKDKAENKIIVAAHTTVLLLFIVLWMLPGIF